MGEIEPALTSLLKSLMTWDLLLHRQYLILTTNKELGGGFPNLEIRRYTDWLTMPMLVAQALLRRPWRMITETATKFHWYQRTGFYNLRCQVYRRPIVCVGMPL